MKTVARTAALLGLVAAIGSLIFYERPLWVADQRTHLKMWRQGIRGHHLTLPDGEIHFLEVKESQHVGNGVPLILVHGLGGRAQDFAALIPQFAAQGFHVYALDLLGYGESSKPASSDFSVATEERILQEFLDSQHIQQADVAGWSMGGWICLKLAADAPQRVRRVAVYDSAGIKFETDTNAELFAPKKPEDVVRLIHAMSPTMKIPAPYVQRDIIRRTNANEWIVRRGLLSMRTMDESLDTRIGLLQQPLLIVWGSKDVLIPPSVGAKMHQMAPRSTLVTVDDCGHFGPRECSAAYAEATGSFLKAGTPFPGGEQHLSRFGDASSSSEVAQQK